MRENPAPDPSRLIYLIGGVLLVGMAVYFLVPTASGVLRGTAAGVTEVMVFLGLIGLGLLACGVVALEVAAGRGPTRQRGFPARGAAAFTALGAAAGIYWLVELRDTLSSVPLLAAVVLVIFFALAGGMWGVVLSGLYGSLRRKGHDPALPEPAGDELA